MCGDAHRVRTINPERENPSLEREREGDTSYSTTLEGILLHSISERERLNYRAGIQIGALSGLKTCSLSKTLFLSLALCLGLLCPRGFRSYTFGRRYLSLSLCLQYLPPPPLMAVVAATATVCVLFLPSGVTESSEEATRHRQRLTTGILSWSKHYCTQTHTSTHYTVSIRGIFPSPLILMAFPFSFLTRPKNLQDLLSGRLCVSEMSSSVLWEFLAPKKRVVAGS